MDNTELSNESRRPVIISQNGAVAASQPEAVQVGIDILKRGGNAADAAISVNAVVNLAQPMSTGLGGDVFCLYYDAKSKTVKGLNGSGRSPAGVTLDQVLSDGYHENNPLPLNHGHTVTVPGAAAAWVDIVDHFGSGMLTMKDILEPAIQYSENGIPITQCSSYYWNKGLPLLLENKHNPHGIDLCINGRAPNWGEVFKNISLAACYKAISSHGKKGFYEGYIAEAIVDAVKANGGTMNLDDLKNHESSVVEPISVEYKGVRLWEIPPNGQGIVALMALNILKAFDFKDMEHNSAKYLHIVIEALRLCFSDALQYVADPTNVDVPITQLLSESYAKSRCSLIQDKSAIDNVPTTADMSKYGGDTICLSVVDKHGNACSLLNSNYKGFGTGIVPKGCGFTLQNRGVGFSLKKEHPNCIAPKKRSFHTVIPAMVTDNKTGDLLSSYVCMGEFMQPQGHVQLLLNMLEFGMNPQEALDKPRFCIKINRNEVDDVRLEEGIKDCAIKDLKLLGHKIEGPLKNHDRSVFGNGYIICKGGWWIKNDRTDISRNTILWAGSDPRHDGIALGY